MAICVSRHLKKYNNIYNNRQWQFKQEILYAHFTTDIPTEKHSVNQAN